MSTGLTHFDKHGQAHMVDVGDKAASKRRAVAEGKIILSAEAFAAVRNGTAKKGDILGIARIAAIQASKRTADLIPLCHPLALSHVAVAFETDEKARTVTVRVAAETTGPTGVEMEALCAVNVGLLTIYDMLKAVDKSMSLTDIRLLSKSGGRSGNWEHTAA